MSQEKSGKQREGADESSFIHRMLNNLKTSKEKRDINVLLLGAIGVGKSTFINAFFNYVNYSSLSKAKSEKLHVPIPSEFTITDENHQELLVKTGEEQAHNENIQAGASTTQACRSYVYPVPGTGLKIRLIDTPGVGDARGIDRDNVNFENVLSFIQELQHLNAICIFLRPKDSNLTVMFEFCIKHLLSRLEKSANQNVMFVFTGTRSTLYRPGETLPWLKTILSTGEVPCEKLNSFCIDNECFRFLAALKNNVQVSSADIDNYTQSWKHSYEECLWMLMYIIGNDANAGLTPHEVKNTISINEARRLIFQLLKPLADVVQLIQDNIRAVNAHQELLKIAETDLSELQSKLYVPAIDLSVMKLNQPVTVCTSTKCSTLYQVSGKRKWRYRKQCHNPCYLRNVPKEIVDSAELATCAVMNSKGQCVKCCCRYQVHMHVYYETETFKNKLENHELTDCTTITTKEEARQRVHNLTLKLANRISKLNKEKKTITKTAAKFACFLKMSAISAYKDTYEAYFEHLIDRETSMKDACDVELIKETKSMLSEYLKEKIAVLTAMTQSQSSSTFFTARDIIDSIQSLYSLKIFGPKIKELFEAQNRARKDENKSQVKEFVFKLNGKTKVAERGGEMQTAQFSSKKPQVYQQNANTRPGSSFRQPRHVPPVRFDANVLPPRPLFFSPLNNYRPQMHPRDIHRFNYPNHPPPIYNQLPRPSYNVPPPQCYQTGNSALQSPRAINAQPPAYFSMTRSEPKPQNKNKEKTEPNNILPQVCDESEPITRHNSKVGRKSHNLFASSSTTESEDE